MNNVSRRGLFKLVAGAGVIAAMPSQAFSRISTIFCDGINCDADGFEALLRGEDVIFNTPSHTSGIYWSGDTLINKLHLYAERTITLGSEVSGKFIESIWLNSYPPGTDPCLRITEEAQDVRIGQVYIDMCKRHLVGEGL